MHNRLIVESEGFEVWVIGGDTGGGHRVPIHPDQSDLVQGRGGGVDGDGGMEESRGHSVLELHSEL